MSREQGVWNVAEFTEVLKQFNRMCWYYQRKRECPIGCPMNGVNISQCRKVTFEEPKETEQIIMEWAADHPIVYPTWWEWLVSIGAVTRKVKPDVASELIETGLLDDIPVDTAKMLGINPKEC